MYLQKRIKLYLCRDCSKSLIMYMRNKLENILNLKYITYRKEKPVFEVRIFTVALFTPVHTIVLVNDLK
jgi:hypothetical protein